MDSMFVTILFTAVKTWDLNTHGWVIKNINFMEYYEYSMGYYSVI